jgi:small conductance mechanosensitive channel
MQFDVETLKNMVIQYGINILAAVIIFIVGKWVARMVADFVKNSMTKAKADKTLASFATNMLYFLIVTFVVIAALSKLGVETTSFVAVIGAAGLAIGLALQGSLSNFAAGVMLILFKPFKAGDMVEAGGAAGEVDEIQIFTTVFKGPDGKTIIVPNSKITSDKITIVKRS